VTKLDKPIQKILETTREVRYSETVKLLKSIGYKERSGKGSHVIFTHDKLSRIVLPHNSVLKKCYVLQIQDVLEDYFKIKK
jgi:predicted RNA binding protein YcfA (HicA-like mRNA interferase family)